jgi:release factor glutamine methyltransferase
MEQTRTIDEALRHNAKRLALYSSTPRLDVEVLFAHVLGVGRTSLLAHADEPPTQDALARFHALVERRSKGEPVAYLTAHKEFYGLDLLITPDVLVPRPETESLVEACLDIIAPEAISQLADIGTGSGAIVVAIARQRPRLHAYATDISPAALEVARLNCEAHGVSERVTLLPGHLLEPLPTSVNVIAANLPYVSPGEAAPEVATWEPTEAVFGGGPDGMALIREFLATVPNYLLPGGSVVMEVAHSQGRLVAELAAQALPGAEVEVRKDLAGYDRIVIISTK